MRNYSEEIAEMYGLNEAVVVGRIYELVNAKPYDPQEPKERREWVRMPLQEWQKELPWICKDTISRILKSVEDRGMVKTMQFGKNRWDMAKWYTLNCDNPLVREVYGEAESYKAFPLFWKK